MWPLGFAVRWLVKAVMVVLAITVLNFVLVRLSPGDPAVVMAGEAGAGDAQFLEQVRKDFQLDQPLAIQLLTYVKKVVTLDLGRSYRSRRAVADMLFERLPATLLLTGAAYLFALIIGPLLGALAAMRARTSGRRNGGTVFGGCLRGGSEASSRVVIAVTSATAVSKASALAAVGRVTPLTLRMYCRAAASISSEVAAGSRPRSSVMFRHIRPG